MAFAQNAKIDSLITALKTAKDDTNKVHLLNTLASKLRVAGEYDRAKTYIGNSLLLSEKITFKKGKANAYSILGTICKDIGDYPEALQNQAASLAIMKETGDKKGQALAYNNIGVIYKNQGNYSEALKQYLITLRIMEELGDEKGKALAYGNIGIVYKNQGNYPEALKNQLAALKIREKIGDREGMSQSYGNIGILYEKQYNYPEALKNHTASLKITIELGDKKNQALQYNNIGNVYGLQYKYVEALENFFASLKIREEIGDKKGIADSYGNIGTVYTFQGNAAKSTKNIPLSNIKYSEAMRYHLLSLKIYEELGDMEGLAVTYINLGNINMFLADYLKAREFLNKGLELSKEVGSKEWVRECHLGLSSLDSSQGKYNEALEEYKLYTAYKDSLLNEESNKQITQMKTLYETEKKDNEIVVLNKDKEIQEKEIGKQKVVRNGFMGGFIVVLLFAGVFFIQRNRISKEKQRSEDLLLNILPAEVAEELKQKGSADAKLIDEVTVIFTDFKGFTSLSEKLSPKELVKDLNECFSAFDHIMGKYGIEKIKTIGDSYMAAGGLPSPNHTHAVDVIKAALEIRDFVAQGKARKLISGEPYFEIRIGIHTGPVVAGIVGVKKFAYDIWGDTVNIASRMESSGEVGKVNISETTYDLVKDIYTCEYRGEIEAKGKGKIKMFFVT